MPYLQHEAQVGYRTFAISGKEMSITGASLDREDLIISGRRCSVWGPKITSTYGARWRMWSPLLESLHSHPHRLPHLLFLSFSVFQRPSWWNTFSCAFSRIEQVFSSSTSASSGDTSVAPPSHLRHLAGQPFLMNRIRSSDSPKF